MNNRSEIKELWIPYKIPRTPDITNNDVYSLTCSNGANSNKNPSQFLQWRIIEAKDCVGLALYTKTIQPPPDTITDPENPPDIITEVRISVGTIAGDLPSGFDPEEGKFIASDGSGFVWAQVNINENTGAITLVDVTGGGQTPNNTNTSFYYTLGYYAYDNDLPSVNNYGCGGIEVRICRNWFAAEAPFYAVTMTRCGCVGEGY
jgi:hypothetical protein